MQQLQRYRQDKVRRMSDGGLQATLLRYF